MKVDGGIGGNLADVPKRAKTLEAAGYDGLMTAETAHDPFLPLALAAEHTEKIELMTSIAVAFARTPMLLANVGHDLNAFSKGRFILGLGSQIRPHITKNGNVDLLINLEISRIVPGSTSQGNPIFDRREVTTHVIVQAGQTIMLSGIIRQEEYEEVRKVPLLGDIPLIGVLFRSRSEGDMEGIYRLY